MTFLPSHAQDLLRGAHNLLAAALGAGYFHAQPQHMKTSFLSVTALAALATSFAFAVEDNNPIKDAMKFAHKAPQGEKKLSDKILDGSAPEADVKKTLALYKAMLDTKPPKGDQAAFKEKVQKLIGATEELVEKKPDATAHYKEAVNCKACHSEHRLPPPGKQ